MYRISLQQLRECGQAKYVLLDNILYEMTEVIEEIKMCARYPRYDQKLGMLSHEEYKAVMREAGDRVNDTPLRSTPPPTPPPTPPSTPLPTRPPTPPSTPPPTPPLPLKTMCLM